MPTISTFSVDSDHVGAVITLDGVSYTVIDFVSNTDAVSPTIEKSTQWTPRPSANFEQVNS